MQTTLHILIILFSLLFFLKYRHRVILFIPVYLILFDVIYGFYQTGSGFGTHRNIALTLLVVYFILIFRKIVVLNIWMTIYLLYVLLLVPFSSNFVESMQGYLSVFASMLLFPVGFYFIRNYSELKVLNTSMIVLASIFVINSLISSVFGLGFDYYGGGVTLGGFITSKLFSASLFLVLLPVILPLTDKTIPKIYIILISGLVFVFLLLSMRRTSIFIPVFGFILYFIFSQKKMLSIATFSVFAFMLLFAYPFYKDALENQFRARRETLEETSLDQEYRYKEAFIVVSETFSDLKTGLFGKEIFNSSGNYNQGKWGTRPIHIDYDLILHGSGIIGLILYLMIFADIFFKYVRYASSVPNDLYMNELKSLFKILLILILLISFNGGMLQLSYRATIFLYLGALLGIFHKYYKYATGQSDDLAVSDNQNVEK